MTTRVAVGDPRTVAVVFPAAATGNVSVDVYSELTGDTDALVATHVGVGGDYSLAMTSAMVAEVDRLTFTFTGIFAGIERSLHEVVEVAGAHYFTVAEARTIGKIASTFTDAQIEAERISVEDQIERKCDTTLVGRFVSETHRGTESALQRLGHRDVLRVIYASIDGTEVTDEVDTSGGRYLMRDSGWLGQVNVRYVRGHMTYPPGDIKEAAISACRYGLLRHNRQGMPAQAITMSTEVGTVRMAVAGPRAPFGIPEIDAIVMALADNLSGQL